MIFVRDLGAMEAFYRDVVGLVPVEATRHPDWVEFAGEARFSLHQIPAHILAGLPPLSGAPRETGATKLSFAVASVSAEVARLRGLGVRLIERPWGSFDFVDPEGNVSGLDGPPGAAVEPLLAAEPVAVAPAPAPESELEPEAEPAPAPAKRGLRNIRVPSLLVMLLFGWLMAAIAGLVPQVTFIFPGRGFVAGPIMLAGLVTMVVGALWLRARAAPAGGGLFRDPVYLGMVIVLAGLAVFLCNPPALLGLAGFVLVMNRRRAAP